MNYITKITWKCNKNSTWHS